MRNKLITILVLSIFLSGCAYVSKDGRFFLGWGEVERDVNGNIKKLSSNSPIKDIFSINAVKD